LADIKKTAVTTPFGLFEFLAMPFGLWNSAQTWQRYINLLIGDIPGVYAYIDNVVIATELEEGHAKLVKKVLSIFHNA
jgi:hypothetical protein